MKQKNRYANNYRKKLFCDFVIECQFIEELLKKAILIYSNEIKIALKKSKISYNITEK